MVVVYPEATVYGPVKVEDARFLVEEHLYKGRIATDLVAPPKQLSGNIGWLRATKATIPPSSVLSWNAPGASIRKTSRSSSPRTATRPSARLCPK